MDFLVSVGGAWEISALVVHFYVGCGGGVGSLGAYCSDNGEPDDLSSPYVVGGGGVGLSEAVGHWVGRLVGRVTLLVGTVRVGGLWPGGSQGFTWREEFFGTFSRKLRSCASTVTAQS